MLNRIDIKKEKITDDGVTSIYLEVDDSILLTKGTRLKYDNEKLNIMEIVTISDIRDLNLPRPYGKKYIKID